MPSSRNGLRFKNRRPAGIIGKLRRIRMVILDVDGVLTDGRIIYGSKGLELRSFDAHDGYGIRKAMQKGITIAWVSGKKSEVVSRRARELGITELYQNIDDKLHVLETLLSTYRLKRDDVCYVGDDEYDLPLLQKIGLSAAPGSALGQVRKQVDYVTKAVGGRGAAREVLDLILNAQGLM